MNKFKKLAALAVIAVLSAALLAPTCGGGNDGEDGLSINARAFIAAVNVLPEPEALTLVYENAVADADGLFGALTAKDKSEPEVIVARDKLIPLKNRIAALKQAAAAELSAEAQAFIAAVDALPLLAAVAVGDEQKVSDAKNLYSAIIAEADKQAEVVINALNRVNALLDKIEELKNEPPVGGGQIADMTSRQIVDYLYANASISKDTQYFYFFSTQEVKDSCANFLGIAGVPIADACAHESMMGVGDYSLVVVRLEAGANAAQWKTSIDDNLKVNKWICTSAEYKRIERIGNVIMAVLATKADADKLATAFLALG